MNSSFDQYDPAAWHRNGVVVEQPESPVAEQRKSHRSSWPSKIILTAALLGCVIPATIETATYSASTAQIGSGFVRLPHDEERDQATPDTDLVDSGYWSGVREFIRSVPPLPDEDTDADPDPLL